MSKDLGSESIPATEHVPKFQRLQNLGHPFVSIASVVAVVRGALISSAMP
jgi:hypothetical protein